MNEGNPDTGAAAAHWWRTELADDGAGRMSRALLRRCSSPVEALAQPATHRLHAALGGGMERRADTLALVAVALASLREDAPGSAAARMGEAGLAALRFQTLIRTHDPAELIRPLRRALAQIDHKARVAELARDLLRWNDATRARWTFAYYGAEAPKPGIIKETEI